MYIVSSFGDVHVLIAIVYSSVKDWKELLATAYRYVPSLAREKPCILTVAITDTRNLAVGLSFTKVRNSLYLAYRTVRLLILGTIGAESDDGSLKEDSRILS